MKLKALIAVLFVAGFASSFALAGGKATRVDTTTGTTTTGTTTTATTTTATTTTSTTTTTPSPTCQRIELRGSKGSGSVSFTVDKANKNGSDLAGKSLTLTIPADARVEANLCRDASGALTIRELRVKGAEKNKGDDHEGDHQNGDHQNGEHNGKDKGNSGKSK